MRVTVAAPEIAEADSEPELEPAPRAAPLREERRRPMLHVHGGTALIALLSRAAIRGEFLSWTEVLCLGPTPAGLTPRKWLDTRARFLDRYFVAPGETPSGPVLEAQDRTLRRFGEYDEVVLWFGPDLYCQTLLAYLLDWFGARYLGDTRLSLVLVTEHADAPGCRSCTPAFLSPESLRAAFDARHPVTETALALGARAWAAITAPKPLELQALATHETPALPPMRAALARHLLELPFVVGGTSFSERAVLAILADGAERELADLFGAFQEREQRQWLTDQAFLVGLERMASGRAPLLALDGARTATEGPLPGRARITRAGASVHAGDSDWIARAGIDRWVGGVHLKGREAAWRWDAAAGAPRAMPLT